MIKAAETNNLQELMYWLAYGVKARFVGWIFLTFRSWANDFGVTALHCAAAKGNLLCVQLLLLNGANVDAQDKNGKVPALYAKEANHFDM